MRRIGIIELAAMWLLLAGPLRLFSETTNTNSPPDFTEVYDLIRAHATGVSAGELNRAAVQGVIAALKPRVLLVGNANESGSDAPLVSKSSLFDGDIAYVRIGRVADGLTKAVAEAWQKLGGTNQPKGLVLDLRYAAGDDYAVTAATADLFLSKERPLLNWGDGVAKSKEKKDAITLPIAVLVNRQTSGAAEALAAVLRETGVALILGSKTAGLAMITQEYSLKNGERLRIATAPVHLGDGSALSSDGIKPDIAVDVSPEDEKSYYADAFRFITKTDLAAGGGLSLTNGTNGTNRPARRNRINEADLVRERREGLTGETEVVTTRERAPEAPLVYDPALARALDLLKGLAVVHQTRS